MGITDLRRLGESRRILRPPKNVNVFVSSENVKPYNRREKTIDPIISYERQNENFKNSQYLPCQKTKQDAVIESGLRKMALYFDNLTRMRIKRMGKSSKWSATQQTVHNKIANISLPAFFGQEKFKQNEQLILKKLNLTSTPDHCIITMARRCGKSESTASGIAGLVVLLQIAIMLCAHRKRAAKLLATTLKSYIQSIPEGKELLRAGKADNQEEINLTTPADKEESMERIIHILPGTPERYVIFFYFLFIFF